MSNLLGKQIGHYRIVDLLGRGGMGEVYAAYDETLERRVAIKSIRSEHRLDATAKNRFLREARVLSQLAHPNICQIYDYIEHDDADVLVLELIRGQSLAQAMKPGVDSREALRIAEEIARVLMAAHEKNIVHRDLKPDNVMLNEQRQVKVLDFGLSRALIDEATFVQQAIAETFALENPDPPVDTVPAVPVDTIPAASMPAAAATLEIEPQQTLQVLPDATVVTPPAAAGTVPVRAPSHGTTQSITALGAIMGTLGYMSPEQASGEVATPASDLYSLGLILQEMFTGKRAYEQGLSGHELLRRAQAGETLPVVGIDPDVSALIDRLKSIPPALRPSAVDTVERIHWILDKPRRKRNKTLLASAIAVLALFGAVMTLQTVRVTRAERVAHREARVAQNVTDFLVELFDVSDPYEEKSGQTVTARELLDKSTARMETQLQGQPEVQGRMLATMGRVYRNLGLFEQARVPLEKSLVLRENTYGKEHADVAESLFYLASLDSDQGRYAEGERRFQRSLAIREKLAGPDDPLVADVLNNLAAMRARQGKLREAEPLLQRSLAIREKALGPASPLVADGLNNLAALNSMQGRSAEAERLYRKSLAIREQVFGLNHPRVGDSLNNLAVEYLEHGRLTEAEPMAQRALAIYERALGPQHPHLADSINNLAEIYQLQHRYEDAAKLYARSLAISEKAYGPDHPSVAYELNYLGKVYVDQNKLAQAEPLLQRALAIYEKSVGLKHPDAAHTLFNLGCLEARKGRRAEALRYLRRAFPAGSDTPWAASIAEEPALVSLHGDPDFDQVLIWSKKPV